MRGTMATGCLLALAACTAGERPATPPAAAEGAEIFPRVRQPADLALRLSDFVFGEIRTAAFSERNGMGPGVIADPVTFSMRPLSENLARRIGEFLTDHEERRLDAAARQHIEDAGRDVRLGAVIKGQCQVEHGVGIVNLGRHGNG